MAVGLAAGEVDLESRFLQLGGSQSSSVLGGCPAKHKDMCLMMCFNGGGSGGFMQIFQNMILCCQLGPWYFWMQGNGLGGWFGSNPYGGIFGGNPYGGIFGGNPYGGIFGGNSNPCGSGGLGCGGGAINPSLIAFSSPLEPVTEETPGDDK